MTEEDGDDGSVAFKIPFYFSPKVEFSTSSAHSVSRARRLAQEVVTLSSSLPFSPSSSVFVRCDEDRLDIMKVRALFYYFKVLSKQGFVETKSRY